MTKTIVHLVRHGEVHNPDRILYGRIPGYHLSTVDIPWQRAQLKPSKAMT